MTRRGSPIPRDWNKISGVSICLLAVGVFCALLLAADSPDLTKLADNAYARIVTPDGNAVANSGFVVMEHSVAVFDTHFTPEAGQALLAAIRTVTPKPVLYVVNSHGHADHTHGNQIFDQAQLIGSGATRRDVLQVDLPSLNRTMGITQSQLDRLRRELAQVKDAAQIQRMREQIKSRADYVETMSRLKIKAPGITVEDSLTIRDGNQEMRILYLGKGHSDGDLVLYLPAQKVVFAGDLFFNEAIPNVQDAFMMSWIKTLEALLRLDAEKFIPGHGRVGTRKDVEAFAAYLNGIQSLVKEAVDRGDSMEQATREIVLPAKYSAYKFQNFFPSNVQKFYAELKALQVPATPPPLPASPKP